MGHKLPPESPSKQSIATARYHVRGAIDALREIGLSAATKTEWLPLHRSVNAFPMDITAHGPLGSCSPLCRNDSSYRSSAYSRASLGKCNEFHTGAYASRSRSCTVSAAVAEPEYLRKHFRHQSLQMKKRLRRALNTSACALRYSFLRGNTPMTSRAKNVTPWGPSEKRALPLIPITVVPPVIRKKSDGQNNCNHESVLFADTLGNLCQKALLRRRQFISHCPTA